MHALAAFSVSGPLRVPAICARAEESVRLCHNFAASLPLDDRLVLERILEYAELNASFSAKGEQQF
jgi:hypothetical protein